MNVFISGGCKNGKSMYAQKLAKAMAEKKSVPLYYLATMRPVDDEDLRRIDRHVEERRGWGFTTIEQSCNICACLEEVSHSPLEHGDSEDREHSDSENQAGSRAFKTIDKKGVFLLDSVTALLSNEMFSTEGDFDPHAPQRVAEDLVKFAELTGNTVFVSDYIYGEAVQYDDITEAYRRGLAFIDRRLAEVCQKVSEVSFGNVIEYKGV